MPPVWFASVFLHSGVRTNDIHQYLHLGVGTQRLCAVEGRADCLSTHDEQHYESHLLYAAETGLYGRYSRDVSTEKSTF